MRLPVTLHFRPSGNLIAALVVAHAVAAFGLAASAIPFAAKAAGLLALVLSLVSCLRRQARPRVVALTLRADGQVEALLPDNETVVLQVDARTTVLPWLVVLLLRGERGMLALALPPDAFTAGEHRQLRLWLRWKAAPA
jgi:hypothetical protein